MRFLRRLVLQQVYFFNATNNWVHALAFCLDPSLTNSTSAPGDSTQAGQIVLGIPLLLAVYNGCAHSVYGDQTPTPSRVRNAILGLIAHEFGHQIQYEILRQEFPDYAPTKSRRAADANLYLELEADALAGALLKTYYHETDQK